MLSRSLQHLRLARLAISELGLKQIVLAALYRIGVKSGYYRIVTPVKISTKQTDDVCCALRIDLVPLPNCEELRAIIQAEILYKEAEEIRNGQVRLFGGNLVPLTLTGDCNVAHWSKIGDENQDIKPVWEAGRFGWAIVLARAYHLSRNEDYAQCFWEYTQAFLEANPPNRGVHWSSAQEVALRLIALAFSAQVFAQSHLSTPQRMSLLSQSIAEHAARITPTLVYARAQNNNHLISEAAGLYTAAAALPDHPQAKHWKRLGWKWLNYAWQNQITLDGEYIQHSTNYHRLMLSLALWVNLLQQRAFPNEPLLPPTLERLKAATYWLWMLLDPESGQTPNLGPNDGANILPLSNCAHSDYRPVIAAASKAFLGEELLGPGLWEEMSDWLGLKRNGISIQAARRSDREPEKSPHIIEMSQSWAYLRAARFTARPGHADQLHLDLWWRGINIAQDAGTYLYTAATPWNNSLTHTAVHNTVMIDNEEQMQRVGRFLYLDWAQAEFMGYECDEARTWQKITVRQDGYRRLGITHQRSVLVSAQNEWHIKDMVIGPTDEKTHVVRVQWLMPDWQYKTESNPSGSAITMHILSPHGWVTLQVQWIDRPVSAPTHVLQWGLARAGKLIEGTGEVNPTWGWTSPTYGYKIPALSLFVNIEARLPINTMSTWQFP